MKEKKLIFLRFLLKNEGNLLHVGLFDEAESIIEEIIAINGNNFNANTSILEFQFDLASSWSLNGKKYRLDDENVAVQTPFKVKTIIGLWNNFYERAKKEGQTIPSFPLYFIKPSVTAIATNNQIISPRELKGQKVIEEAELGIVIGRDCKNLLSVEDAKNYIFGYTCVNDVTAVKTLFEDKSFQQWSRSKGFDTFSPFGPFVLQTQKDPKDWIVKAIVNGKIKQNYPVSDMIFSPWQIVYHLSQVFTLQAGDLICCGTSLGAVSMKHGDVCVVEIEGIPGKLINTFVDQSIAATSKI